ncbi:hypothetical protein M8494_23760 [Serratia ureilytica]
MTHAEHALARLTHHGEGFRDQAFQRFTLLQARAEFVGFRFQLIIGQFSMSGSMRLICSTTLRMRRRVRSLRLPKTLVNNFTNMMFDISVMTA